MYEKLYMAAKFWRQDVRISHLQKSIRTFVFEKVKTWTSTWHCLVGRPTDYSKPLDKNCGWGSDWSWGVHNTGLKGTVFKSKGFGGMRLRKQIRSYTKNCLFNANLLKQICCMHYFPYLWHFCHNFVLNSKLNNEPSKFYCTAQWAWRI